MTDTATVRGYKVVFDQGATNWGAVVEDIPGVCFTVADTREECERHIAEAIDAHLEALKRRREGRFEPAVNERSQTA